MPRQLRPYQRPYPPTRWRGLFRWIRRQPWETFKALGVLAVILAAATSFFVTYRTFSASTTAAKTAEAGLNTERFKDGVTELGSADENVQAGGIFTLARVAAESPSDADHANKIILFFVRGHLCDNPVAGPKARQSGPPKSVVAGLEVLPHSPDHRIDLTGLTCQAPHLSLKDDSAADLARVDLTDVNLAGSHLAGARLQGAILINACLSGADIDDADFEGADLTGTDLTSLKGLKPGQLAATHANAAHPPKLDPAKPSC
jgi:pentapeptide repeat protein